MRATRRRRIRARSAAILTAVMLIVGAFAPAQASAVTSVTGMFLDGWYPESYAPDRPLNLDPATMTAVTDTGAVVIQGTAVENGQIWSTTIFGPNDNGGPLPTVGSSGFSVVQGPGMQCGSGLEGHADILEASYNGPTVLRFAATVWSRCSSGNPMPEYVRTDVRYHSTIGFHAFRVTPLVPPFGLIPPDLDLGDLHVGDAPATGSFTITNTGSLPLVVGAGAPTDDHFSVAGSACDLTAVVPGGTCTIDVSFAPTRAGQLDATAALLTPDLPRSTRPLRVRGTGIQATTLAVSLVPTSSVLSSEPGLTWFEFHATPADLSAFIDVHLTCGPDRSFNLNPVIPNPQPIIPALPAGPCSASFDLYAQHYEPSHVELAFTVGSYVNVLFSTETHGNIVRAGEPFQLRTWLLPVNGASPTGGSITVTDLDTDAVLVDRPVTAETLDAVSAVAGLPAGIHPIRVAYSGDAAVEPWARESSITVDGDPPDGTVAIDAGAGYTSDPAVELDLTANDPTSEVTNVRVSNAASTSDGVLVNGVTAAAGSTLAWQLAPTDGSRKVYVQWRDEAGNWSVPTSDAIVLDRVAPTVSGLSAAMVQGGALSSGRIPVKVTFAASDATSGVLMTRLDVSRDGGAWTSAGAGTTRTVYLAPGHAYRFRGVATDRAGNARIGATSAALNLAAIDESATSVVRRGSWTFPTLTGALGGKVARSVTAGSSISWTGMARSLALIGPLRPTGGTGRVYVDGVYRGTLSFRSATGTGPLVRYAVRWATTGTHSIRVVVSSGVVAVDAFARW